jgi:hypothetical protein
MATSSAAAVRLAAKAKADFMDRALPLGREGDKES